MKTYTKRRDRPTARISTLALVAATVILLPTVAAALESQHQRYLSRIRADLESLGIELRPMEGEERDLAADSIDATSPGDEAKPDSADAQAEFEDKLKERAPGTFILYQRLTPTQKARVFTDYRETGDLRRVRDKIMELVLGR